MASGLIFSAATGSDRLRFRDLAVGYEDDHGDIDEVFLRRAYTLDGAERSFGLSVTVLWALRRHKNIARVAGYMS